MSRRASGAEGDALREREVKRRFAAGVTLHSRVETLATQGRVSPSCADLRGLLIGVASRPPERKEHHEHAEAAREHEPTPENTAATEQERTCSRHNHRTADDQPSA